MNPFKLPNNTASVITVADTSRTLKNFIERSGGGTITGENIGTGDNLEVTFSGTLAHTLLRVSTLTITDTVETFSDNGDGTLTGDLTGTGTINYSTGAFSVTFDTAPGLAQAITAGYEYDLEVSGWENSLNSIILTVEGTAGTNDARLLFDGNTPTATAGLRLFAGNRYEYNGPSLDKFKLIRVGGSSATISLQIGWAGESNR